MRIATITLPLLLAACAQEGFHVEMSDQATLGRVSYVVPVIDQAERDFFGNGGAGSGGFGGGGGEGGGFGSGGFSGMDLGLDDKAEVLGLPPSQAAISLVWERTIAPGWQLRPVVSVARHDGKIFLPEGMGVLTDPMTIDLSAEALSAELALMHEGRLAQDWSASYGAGLGFQQVRGRAHFTSALIDLTSRVTIAQPYLQANGAVIHDNGFGLSGQVLYYAPNAAEFRLGAFQSF